MRGKLAITAAAMLLAGTFATAAQQTKQPQEPRGEESTRSATPRGQQSGPDQTRGQGGMTGNQGSTGKQQTPQEPRGEESERSATPRGQQK